MPADMNSALLELDKWQRMGALAFGETIKTADLLELLWTTRLHPHYTHLKRNAQYDSKLGSAHIPASPSAQ
jgi:hypothetical protein